MSKSIKGLMFVLFMLQIFNSKINAEIFTTDNGLSSSLINHILQDSNNNIWISTENGLNKYDGAKILTYKHNANDPESLSNDFIKLTYTDDTTLYIGTIKDLCKLDTRNDKFTKIPLILYQGSEINANITCMIKRANGDIYVGTAGHGLFVIQKGDTVAKQKKLVSSFYITRLLEDSQKRLWIATSDQGIFVIDNNGLGYNYKYSTPNNRDAIAAICETNDKNIYVASVRSGLYICNQKANTLDKINDKELENIPIVTLYKTDSTLIIGTDGNGLKSYNYYNKQVTNYKVNSQEMDISKTKVHSILNDSYGNLWLGIFQKGIVVIPSKNNKFGFIGQKSVYYNVIGSNSIMSIFQDQSGNKWIGTDYDGIYNLDSNNNLIKHYEFNRLIGTAPSTSMSIAEDYQHKIWVGSYFNGLYIIDPATKSCKKITNLYGTDIPRGAIYSIVKDKYNNMWLGYMGKGLYKIDIKNHTVDAYQAVSGTIFREDMNVLHNAWINNLYISSDNKLYIGTYDGLGCYDIEENSFTSTFNKNRIFSGDVIYTIREDIKHNIWLGSENGLICINPQTQECKQYSTNDKLPNNIICGIEIDNNDNIWASTSNGISHIDTKHEYISNYLTIDGLQCSEYNKTASFKNKNGIIFFGGTNGITYFDPTEIHKDATEPTIKIADIYEQNRRILPISKSGGYTIIGKADDSYNYKYDFDYKNNSITIELATTKYFDNQHISYLYKINDGDWVELNNGSNKITLNSLSPDQYDIKIKSKNELKESDIQSILLTIHAAWYATKTAKVCYIISILLIFAIILIQTRTKYIAEQKLQEHISKERINEAKINFFTDISHDIRTPMTLIISPLQKLIKTDKDKDRAECYNTIYINANRILRLINQLLDVRKIDNGQLSLKFKETNIHDAILNIYNAFSLQAQNNNIDFKFNDNTTNLNEYIDIEQFDKIISNILSNAFKFTPNGGNITISLNATNNNYTINIADSGIGIKNGEEEHIFERFYQSESSSHNNSNGTGIGLHLTRSLVKLHYGEITVKNNDNNIGCHFVITLPRGKSHLSKDEIYSGTPIVEQLIDNIEIVNKIENNNVQNDKNIHKKYTIAIVEDDSNIREYLTKEFQNTYNIDTYDDGKEGLNNILRKKYDLVISDITMPNLDGITLCRKIKQNIKTNHIPVIIISAKCDEKDKIDGLNNGADSYITKPFSIDLLSQNIINLIRNREQLKANFSGLQDQGKISKTIKELSPDEKLIEKVMLVINKHFDDPELNVEMLANEVGISRVHLHRKLREITGQTSRDFIRNARLQKAAKLLTEKRYDINRVAEMVGIENTNYFSTLFKQMYGVTPTTYQNEHFEENNGTPDNNA